MMASLGLFRATMISSALSGMNSGELSYANMAGPLVIFTWRITSSGRTIWVMGSLVAMKATPIPLQKMPLVTLEKYAVLPKGVEIIKPSPSISCSSPW